MERMTVSKARVDMKDLVNRVAYGKERIYLTAHDKSIVAMVPIEDVEALKAMEDAEDIRLAQEAYEDIKKNGTISHEELLKRLGLDV